MFHDNNYKMLVMMYGRCNLYAAFLFFISYAIIFDVVFYSLTISYHVISLVLLLQLNYLYIIRKSKIISCSVKMICPYCF